MEPNDPLWRPLKGAAKRRTVEPALEWTQGSVMMQKRTRPEINYLLVMKEPLFHAVYLEIFK